MSVGAAPALDGAMLDAVIDRIIPRDADPGALDLGAQRFVRTRLGEDAPQAAALAAGLERLRSLAGPMDFAALPDERKDALLRAVEAEPWFVALVERVAEGFYADPANGGNDGARSWAMIGYRHGIPEAPGASRAPAERR